MEYLYFSDMFVHAFLYVKIPIKANNLLDPILEYIVKYLWNRFDNVFPFQCLLIRPNC